MSDATRYHRGVKISAKYAGYCKGCGASIFKGETITHIPKTRKYYCGVCSGDRKAVPA